MPFGKMCSFCPDYSVFMVIQTRWGKKCGSKRFILVPVGKSEPVTRAKLSLLPLGRCKKLLR